MTYEIYDLITFTEIKNTTLSTSIYVPKNSCIIDNIDEVSIGIRYVYSDVYLEIIPYVDLVSPTSVDVFDLVGNVLPTYFYFYDGSGVPIQPGTTTNSTLRWDGSNWVESLEVLNDDTTLFYPGTVVGTVTTSISGNITENSGFTTILVDTLAAAGNITLTLPARAVIGRTYRIKDKTGNSNINNIIINAAVGEFIDGSVSITIKQKYNSVDLVFDGTSQWSIL